MVIWVSHSEERAEEMAEKEVNVTLTVEDVMVKEVIKINEERRSKKPLN